jgi:hypothetical protein
VKSTQSASRRVEEGSLHTIDERNGKKRSEGRWVPKLSDARE